MSIKNNDDDYIHPLLETILMKAIELEIHSRYRREDGTVGHRHHPDAEKAKLLYEAIDRFYLKGKPYLADRAKAVLTAVEKEMKECDKYPDCEMCPLDGADCPLGPIRDAWKKETP